jgi:multiple sugar transport system substrate-binding protein
MSVSKISRRELITGGLGTVAALAAASAPWASLPASAQAAKPSQLRMLYATVEADADAIKLVLPDFQKETGIALQVDNMPYNALQQKVFSELASSSPYYDIMIVDTPWMPSLTSKVQPLSAYITNRKLSGSGLQLSDFISKVFYDTAVYNPAQSSAHFPSTPSTPIDVAAIKKAGFDIYGLPIQANVLTMSYRKDLFDSPTERDAFKQKNGGKALVVPQTWTDFTTVAQFFTRPEQRLFGTTLMAGDGDWATDDFKTLLAGWGGDGHLVDDRFRPVFNSPAGVEALSYYVDLINKYKVTPPGATSFSWDEAASTFGAGLTAMSMNYHTETLNANVKGAIEYAMIPKGVSRGPHFGTWMLSVNPKSQNAEAAYAAIVWLTSAAAQTKMLEAQLHPTRHSVYKASRTIDATKKFGQFYPVLEQSLGVGVGRPRLKNYADVDHAVWVAVNNAASGRATPQAALQSAADQVSQLMKQAGYAT